MAIAYLLDRSCQGKSHPAHAVGVFNKLVKLVEEKLLLNHTENLVFIGDFMNQPGNSE